MLLRLEHPALAGTRVEVQSAGILSGMALLVNGDKQKPVRRLEYVFRNSRGEQVTLKLVPTLCDPIPHTVNINGQAVQLARKLEWYEMAFMYAPLTMIFFGGGIGGLLGGAAAYGNSFVFRSQLSGGLKYVVAALISLSAFGSYILAAGLIYNQFHPGENSSSSAVADEQATKRAQQSRDDEKTTQLAKAIATNGLRTAETMSLAQDTFLSNISSQRNQDMAQSLQGKLIQLGAHDFTVSYLEKEKQILIRRSSNGQAIAINL